MASKIMINHRTALTVSIGWQEERPVLKNVHQFSWDILFWNKWKNKI